MVASGSPPTMEKFDWIQLKSDMDKIHKDETIWEKVQRKCGENPVVPIGCFATVCALSAGLYSMKVGNRQMSQKMMRLRIGAQGFTVVALVVGVILTSEMAKKS